MCRPSSLTDQRFGGVQNGHTPLHRAVISNHYVVVMRLLEKLRILEQPTVVGAGVSTGATPLHYAAADGRVEMIRMLKLYGGHVQQPDDEGNRPLHWAVLKGAETSVECLVAEGADINARGEGGRTAMHDAVISKQVRMIHTLHRLRANFEHKDDVRGPLSPPRFALTCGIGVLVPLN